MVRHQQGKPTPSYKNHRALDDKAGVVTAITTTTGAIDEASELIELIERHERVTAAKTKVAVADSRYGNTANLIALAQREIRAHVADLRSKLRNARSQGIYPPERFVYQTKTDDYRCPAGEILYRHHFVARRGYYEYRPKRGTCEGCRLREFCTRDQNGRTLKRYRARSFWIRRASNPIPRKRALTASAGNGFKSATSPRQPFSTALSELAGADCGDKAFRIT